MNIILFTGFHNKTSNIRLSVGLVLTVLLLLVVGIAGGVGWAGYKLGLDQAKAVHEEVEPTDLVLHAALDEQRRGLLETREQTREHLDALALRLGQMQSHIMRLDALGERLAKIGLLDQSEFDFSVTPAVGGLDASESAESLEFSELLSDLQLLSRTIDDRERKLNFMEELIMNRKLQQDVHPAGRPVEKGWISSRFGYRKDPFTGRRAFHHGVDFAGQKGANVVSVAAGVVAWSGKLNGYGDMVEINHGNGYATRYGHNGKLLVEVGERVAKGQLIATMGSTGRSTGPHVHFEVLKNGKPVNPWKYLRASK